MTQADLGLTLIILVTVALFTAWVFLVPLRRERRKTLRYPLFACRHRIVMLVADGKIEESDEVFQFLYKSVNYLIPQPQQMGRLEIVRAMLASPIAKLAEDDAFRERFTKMLNHDDPAVRRVAREFFVALKTKLAKIWSVAIMVTFAGWGFSAGATLLDRVVRRMGASPAEGAEIYRALDEMTEELAAA